MRIKLAQNKLIDGFKFGMVLQFVLGPVFFFVFQTSMIKGLIPALLATLGVTAIDALYILLAVVGVGQLIEKNKKIETFLKYFGSLILIIFGIFLLFDTLRGDLSTSFNVADAAYQNPFLTAAILTLSSPLTIIFWTGVFASKTINENMKVNELTLFAIGALLSTLIFLSATSILGNFTKLFVNNHIISLLNIAVGLLLIFFGIKPLVKNN